MECLDNLPPIHRTLTLVSKHGDYYFKVPPVLPASKDHEHWESDSLTLPRFDTKLSFVLPSMLSSNQTAELSS